MLREDFLRMSMIALVFGLMISHGPIAMADFRIGNNYEQPIPAVKDVQPPTVSIQSVRTVNEGDTILLTANAVVDVTKGGSPFFYWHTTKGFFEHDPEYPDYSTVKFIAPFVSGSNESVRITVHVGDSLGYVAIESISLDILETGNETPIFKIEGYTVDYDSIALDDVEVEVLGVEPVYSNASGSFQIPSLPEGTYLVSAYKSGYKFYPTSASVILNSDTPVVRVEFKAEAFNGLLVKKTGSGQGMILVGDVTCDTDCLEVKIPQTDKTALVLKAVAEPGSRFVRWETSDRGPLTERVFHTQPGVTIFAVFETN